MFDCKCGKRHKKTSEIGRAHFKLYFPTEYAIEHDKPDPKVREEIMSEEAKAAWAPAVLDANDLPNVTAEITGALNPPKKEETWHADKNQRTMTVYALDRYLLKNHKKRDLKYIIEYCIVTKQHEELKANFRASSWEDKQTHAMIPFTIDEEEKYAMLVDARNKKKTGLLRKHGAVKALKEAVKPWEPPKTG